VITQGIPSPDNISATNSISLTRDRSLTCDRPAPATAADLAARDRAHFGEIVPAILRITKVRAASTTDSLPSAASSGHHARVVVRTGRPTERYGASLDDVSKAIIEELQQDGRKPYAAIGKVVGLSEAAVRQRVQRLLDHGVMQIVAVTDPLELGFARQAMIGIRAEGDVELIADELANMVELEYVVITAGSFDILAEVVCESDEQLLEI
jgi:Lrp/AsnC family transcriptional regulator for asnA, asnC and gidA